MKWKTFPEMPNQGDHIIAHCKGYEKNKFIEMTIRECEGLAHIDQWCDYDIYMNHI